MKKQVIGILLILLGILVIFSGFYSSLTWKITTFQADLESKGIGYSIPSGFEFGSFFIPALIGVIVIYFGIQNFKYLHGVLGQLI